jgi:hypothetical protein
MTRLGWTTMRSGGGGTDDGNLGWGDACVGKVCV